MRLAGFKHYLSRLAPKWLAKRTSSDTLFGLNPAEDAREQAAARSCLRALRRTSIALRSSFLHKKKSRIELVNWQLLNYKTRVQQPTTINGQQT
jgi:hypothetical protein